MPEITIFSTATGQGIHVASYGRRHDGRDYLNPTPASLARVKAVIKAYRAYVTDCPPHWTRYALIFEPVKRNHYAQLHTRPIVTGQRWEIDEEIYFVFLGMLPPLAWTPAGFYMSEFIQGNITTKYTREGRKYYCEFAEYPPRKEASR